MQHSHSCWIRTDKKAQFQTATAGQKPEATVPHIPHTYLHSSPLTERKSGALNGMNTDKTLQKHLQINVPTGEAFYTQLSAKRQDFILLFDVFGQVGLQVKHIQTISATSKNTSFFNVTFKEQHLTWSTCEHQVSRALWTVTRDLENTSTHLRDAQNQSI